MPQDYDKTPFQRLFELFGCEFSVLHGKEVHATECPFCGKDKCYLNTETGVYKCHSENTCGEAGNAYTFVRWVHRTSLEATTDDHLRRLKAKRGLPLQTLKAHELAWNDATGCWLIPHKSEKGEVLNLCRYYLASGDKRMLPGLPLQLYGLDRLSADASRTLFICEGALDAIALDQHLVRNKTRTRYDILAAPSANVFNTDWLKHLAGRTVRLCLDNDNAGRKGQERIVKMVLEEKVDCRLLALNWPAGYPEKCDIGDLIRDGVNIAEFTREHCVKVGSPQRRIRFTRGDEIPDEKLEWLWPGRIPFGTFASLSGYMGTHKSGIARALAARCTAGLPMPHTTKALPPFGVLYFTSEDSAAQVRDLVRVHDGDLTRLHVHDIACSDEPIDILDCLEEIEAEINARQARLVILDALNSFVGGDISTDAKARRTLSGRLQGLARRTGACIIGIRNWGRSEGGTAAQKALGATSLSDVARCVMNTAVVLKKDGQIDHHRLEFEKVSGTPPPPSLRFSVKDLGSPDASHLRQIKWFCEDEAEIKAAIKKVAKKSSNADAPRLAVETGHGQ
jgi:hypothetical protein